MLTKTKFQKHYFYHLAFGVTMILAFFFRLRYVFSERMWPDEALYSWYAKSIFIDPSYIFSKEIIEFHPPLFSILLSLGHFFMSPETACRFVPLIINMIGIAAIYYLGVKVRSHFAGLISAITLAFSPFYFSVGIKTLADGPISVLFILLVILLLKIDEKNHMRYDVYAGLLGAAIILLKWSGLLVIPFLIIYYLFAFTKMPVKKRLKKAVIPMSIIGFVVILLFANNIIQIGRIFPSFPAISGDYNPQPFWFYVFELDEILLMYFLIPFFIYGIYVLSIRHDRRDKLLLIWFAVLFVAISVAREKAFRFTLLVIPSMMLICAIAIEEFLEKVFRNKRKLFAGKMVFLTCIILFFIALFPLMKTYFELGSHDFAGFKKVGEWIKLNDTSEAMILTTSPRIVRYYSDVEFKKYGGRIQEFPKAKKFFEQIIGDAEGPVILVVDIWELTQPAWIYLIDDKKTRYLEGLGFELKKVIKKPRVTEKHLQELKPGIWIFMRS